MQAVCLEPFNISWGDMAKLTRVTFCLQLFLLTCGSKPQSLDDLVKAGYLKQLPEDPFTGRSDTWTADFSKDPKALGIINVRSGSDLRDKSGVPYKDW
jgi:general secretion pathway protein G